MEKEKLDKEISDLILLSGKAIINNLDKKTYEVFILMVKDILKQKVSDQAKTAAIIMNATSYIEAVTKEGQEEGAHEEKQS